MSFTTRKAVAGGIAGTALVVALGIAAVAQGAGAGPTSPSTTVARATEQATDPGPAAVETPPDTAPPATTAPTTTPAAPAPAPPTTATTRKAPTTTVAPAAKAPTTVAPTTTPTTAKLPPGQRVAYTAAAVQAATAAITQRIPLFAPTDAQLRTFADAVCTSFDQGQTWAQVTATIRQAVTHIQGQSLSDADAAFMVQTVTRLRCPGYLP